MPRGSIFDEKGIDKIGEEGGASAPRPNFCFGPRTLILKKNTWNFLCFLFESANFFKISVRGPKQKLGRGADAPPLLADFVNSLLIGNRPPWHLSLDILTSRRRFWLHSGTGATLARATVKPESRVRRSLW